MQLSVQFSSFLLVLSAGLALAAPQNRTVIGATYHLTNNKQGNNIVIHSIHSGGTVNYSRSVSAGGAGASYQTDTGAPGPDSLRSAGSVVVSGQRLFTVNAGSDTVAMFNIDSRDPTQIHQVGRSVNSGGNFPVSVAISSKNGNVCALNGGANNGVQCFRATSQGLQTIANSNRAFQFNETTPPNGANTTFGVSTILFSPDGSRLVVDVKGQREGNVPGFLAVWNVNSDGSLSQTYQSFPAPTRQGQQNFGMTRLHGMEGYVMADSSQGGLVYDFSGGYNSQVRARNIVTPGQMITCWSIYASKSNTYFFTDAGTEIISEYSINNSNLNATLVRQYHLPQDVVVLDTEVGTFGNNQYLYQLAAVGSGLFVFDVRSAGNSQLIQSYNFTQGLINDNIPFNSAQQGMAIFVKNQ